MFSNTYNERSVLVTGHTGFKGSWLCEWLLSLGAKVTGLALNPEGSSSFYDELGLSSRLQADLRQDICDLPALTEAIKSARPDFVFHLAAQPLVRLSYDIPVETFATNVMGTANILEAVRLSGHPCTVLVITTDKCYENREWLHSYREEDAMGGYDPYSASKGCAELVVSAYRRSFFSHAGSPVKLASARAGNVIGGGDWAKDRIIPDCFRALRAGQSIPVRNRIATRPWQHVLEPLSGYLWLAANLATREHEAGLKQDDFATAFNFGPNLTSNRTVAELVQELLKHTGGSWTDASSPDAVHEASKLNLTIDKAFHLLNWKPVWNFEQTVQKTAEWYNATAGNVTAADITREQIAAYATAAQSYGTAWAAAT